MLISTILNLMFLFLKMFLLLSKKTGFNDIDFFLDTMLVLEWILKDGGLLHLKILPFKSPQDAGKNRIFESIYNRSCKY